MMRTLMVLGILTVLLALTQFVSAGPFGLFRRCQPRCIPCPPPVPAMRMPFADKPVTLQLKFEKGKDFYVEATTHTKQKMRVRGTDVEQTTEQVFVWHYQPLEQTPEGDWLIRIRLVAMRMDINIGGNRIQYDSTKPQPRNPMIDFFEKLTKADFKATIQVAGLIRKVQGREEFMKMLEGDPASSHALMGAIMKEDSLKQMFTPLGDFLPAAPVRLGDGWRRTRTLDLGPIGRYVTNYQYSYHGSAGPLHEIRVKSSMSYMPPVKDGGANLPFIIKKADLRSIAGEGTILFDAEKGWVHEATMRMPLAGALAIQVGSLATDVTLEQTQTTRTRTMDTYSRPKKR